MISKLPLCAIKIDIIAYVRKLLKVKEEKITVSNKSLQFLRWLLTYLLYIDDTTMKY